MKQAVDVVTIANHPVSDALARYEWHIKWNGEKSAEQWLAEKYGATLAILLKDVRRARELLAVRIAEVEAHYDKF